MLIQKAVKITKLQNKLHFSSYDPIYLHVKRKTGKSRQEGGRLHWILIEIVLKLL